MALDQSVKKLKILQIEEDFSDEIILKIFSYLSTEDIITCSTVHEKFHRIAFDESVWRAHRKFDKINLAGKLVPLGLVQLLFKLGTKFLCLEGATILTEFKIVPSVNMHWVDEIRLDENEVSNIDSVKYLDLSHLQCRPNKRETQSEALNICLKRILSTCTCLTKLSLQGLRIFDRTFTQYISETESLTHLNLFSCSGLVWSDIRIIVLTCGELIELNLGNCKIAKSYHWEGETQKEANLETVCNCLPKEMLKLSLSNQDINDAVVKTLVNRCQNLTELDLYGPPNPNLTGKAATEIIQVLSPSLVKLAVPCFAEETKPLELASMPKLNCLWMSGLSGRRRKILKKQVPHLKINETDELLSSTIASPRETYLRHEGFWEVPCKILNYNSVQKQLSEVNENWTRIGDLETT